MMDELIRRLAEACADLARLKAEKDDLAAEILLLIAERYDAETTRLTNAVVAADEEAKDAYEAVAAAAVERFNVTGDKHPHPAVSVGEYTVLEYDVGEAVNHCAENLLLRSALKLDKRKFEGVAKELSMPFVTITKEPRARIARDLSAYLEVEGEEHPF